MFDLPVYIWVLVGIAGLGAPATLGLALYRGGIASGLAGAKSALLGSAGLAALAAWVAAAATLAGKGAFLTSGVVPVVASTVLLALLLASRIPIVRRSLADERAPARLALVHTFRLVGFVWIALMLLGRLPAVFALPAGLGDMAIGVAAPFVATRIFRRGPYGIGVWEFNLLGILDLLVAVSVGTAAGLLGVSPSTVPLALLPLAVVSTALVPLSLASHLVALWQVRLLRSRRRHSDVITPAAA